MPQAISSESFNSNCNIANSTLVSAAIAEWIHKLSFITPSFIKEYKKFEQNDNGNWSLFVNDFVSSHSFHSSFKEIMNTFPIELINAPLRVLLGVIPQSGTETCAELGEFIRKIPSEIDLESGVNFSIAKIVPLVFGLDAIQVLIKKYDGKNLRSSLLSKFIVASFSNPIVEPSHALSSWIAFQWSVIIGYVCKTEGIHICTQFVSRLEENNPKTLIYYLKMMQFVSTVPENEEEKQIFSQVIDRCSDLINSKVQNLLDLKLCNFQFLARFICNLDFTNDSLSSPMKTWLISKMADLFSLVKNYFENISASNSVASEDEKYSCLILLISILQRGPTDFYRQHSDSLVSDILGTKYLKDGIIPSFALAALPQLLHSDKATILEQINAETIFIPSTIPKDFGQQGKFLKKINDSLFAFQTIGLSSSSIPFGISLLYKIGSINLRFVIEESLPSLLTIDNLDEKGIILIAITLGALSKILNNKETGLPFKSQENFENMIFYIVATYRSFIRDLFFECDKIISLNNLPPQNSFFGNFNDKTMIDTSSIPILLTKKHCIINEEYSTTSIGSDSKVEQIVKTWFLACSIEPPSVTSNEITVSNEIKPLELTSLQSRYIILMEQLLAVIPYFPISDLLYGHIFIGTYVMHPHFDISVAATRAILLACKVRDSRNDKILRALINTFSFSGISNHANALNFLSLVHKFVNEYFLYATVNTHLISLLEEVVWGYLASSCRKIRMCCFEILSCIDSKMTSDYKSILHEINEIEKDLALTVRNAYLNLQDAADSELSPNTEWIPFVDAINSNIFILWKHYYAEFTACLAKSKIISLSFLKFVEKRWGLFLRQQEYLEEQRQDFSVIIFTLVLMNSYCVDFMQDAPSAFTAAFEALLEIGKFSWRSGVLHGVGVYFRNPDLIAQVSDLFCEKIFNEENINYDALITFVRNICYYDSFICAGDSVVDLIKKLFRVFLKNDPVNLDQWDKISFILSRYCSALQKFPDLKLTGCTPDETLSTLEGFKKMADRLNSEDLNGKALDVYVKLLGNIDSVLLYEDILSLEWPGTWKPWVKSIITNGIIPFKSFVKYNYFNCISTYFWRASDPESKEFREHLLEIIAIYDKNEDMLSVFENSSDNIRYSSIYSSKIYQPKLSNFLMDFSSSTLANIVFLEVLHSVESSAVDWHFTKFVYSKHFNGNESSDPTSLISDLCNHSSSFRAQFVSCFLQYMHRSENEHTIVASVATSNSLKAKELNNYSNSLKLRAAEIFFQVISKMRFDFNSYSLEDKISLQKIFSMMSFEYLLPYLIGFLGNYFDTSMIYDENDAKRVYELLSFLSIKSSDFSTLLKPCIIAYVKTSPGLFLRPLTTYLNVFDNDADDNLVREQSIPQHIEMAHYILTSVNQNMTVTVNCGIDEQNRHALDIIQELFESDSGSVLMPWLHLFLTKILLSSDKLNDGLLHLILKTLLSNFVYEQEHKKFYELIQMPVSLDWKCLGSASTDDSTSSFNDSSLMKIQIETLLSNICTIAGIENPNFCLEWSQMILQGISRDTSDAVMTSKLMELYSSLVKFSPSQIKNNIKLLCQIVVDCVIVFDNIASISEKEIDYEESRHLAQSLLNGSLSAIESQLSSANSELISKEVFAICLTVFMLPTNSFKNEQNICLNILSSTNHTNEENFLTSVYQQHALETMPKASHVILQPLFHCIDDLFFTKRFMELLLESCNKDDSTIECLIVYVIYSLAFKEPFKNCYLSNIFTNTESAVSFMFEQLDSLDDPSLAAVLYGFVSLNEIFYLPVVTIIEAYFDYFFGSSNTNSNLLKQSNPILQVLKKLPQSQFEQDNAKELQNLICKLFSMSQNELVLTEDEKLIGLSLESGTEEPAEQFTGFVLYLALNEAVAYSNAVMFSSAWFEEDLESSFEEDQVSEIEQDAQENFENDVLDEEAVPDNEEHSIIEHKEISEEEEEEEENIHTVEDNQEAEPETTAESNETNEI